MSFRFLSRTPKVKEPQTQVIAPKPDVKPADGAPEPCRTERSVLVTHGIHSGSFPVTGLPIREARRTLTPLLNIDPQAVAVINGQIVSEDHVIGPEVSLLSFVKPSAIKG